MEIKCNRVVGQLYCEKPATHFYPEYLGWEAIALCEEHAFDKDSEFPEWSKEDHIVWSVFEK